MLELSDAPQSVVNFISGIKDRLLVLEATPAVYTLQQRYLEAGILTPKWEDDAFHVAMASIAECDVLVSWNFKHLVNYRKISQYNRINEALGYHMIEIRTPIEVMDYDDQEKI